VHYTSKKSTRTRKAKKAHHLRTLQSARAATCLVHPFPARTARGKESESGTRHRAALTVGHATVERLPVAISELFPHPSAVDGLLWMDFLGQLIVTLDRATQQM
jgi:hypothetical protein